MRVVLMVVLCLAVVDCGSKTSKRKQAKLCLKSMGTVEKKCVEKGYQPPPEVACNFDVITPSKEKKGKKEPKLKYNKKKCEKEAEYFVSNCPDYHCGTTTTTSLLRLLLFLLPLRVLDTCCDSDHWIPLLNRHPF